MNEEKKKKGHVITIWGIKSDDPLWRQFKGIASMEGLTIARALKEAIRLWIKSKGYEPKDGT